MRVLAARAAAFPVGTVARVELDGRLFVAEVRDDFGVPRWAGSWHGFTLPADRKLRILSVIAS